MKTERVFEVGKAGETAELREEPLRWMLSILTQHDTHSRSVDTLIDLIVASPHTHHEVGMFRVAFDPDKQPASIVLGERVMGQEEYVEHGGQLCPKCCSKDVESQGAVQSDDDGYWQDAHCNGCGAEWTDDLKLTGYRDLKLATTIEIEG